MLEQRARILKEIFEYNPSLEAFYKSEENLNDYSRSLYDFEIDSIHLERQQTYKALIQDRINRIFSEEERAKIHLNFEEKITAVTADHHGILNHPLLLGGNVVAGYFRIFSENQEDKFDILGLTCGNVPLNEVLNRRGFDLHGKHVNLFPREFKHRLVQTLPKMEFNIIDSVTRSGQESEFTSEELAFLQKLELLIKQIDFNNCKKYSEQITKINFYIWPLIFSPEIRKQMVNLIQLEHDDILIDALCKLLTDGENFLHFSLFNKKFRENIIKTFEGVYGAWTSNSEKGAHFFWALKEGEQVRLALKGDTLVSTDPEFSYEVKLSAQAIIEALEKGKIIPSILLKFATLTFYCGIKPLGGMGQIGYLTEMRDKWANVLQPDFPAEAEFVKQFNTTGLINLSLFFEKESDKIIEQSALDLVMAGGATKQYFEGLDKMRYKDFMLPTVPMTYHRVIPLEKRENIDFTKLELFEKFNWI